jgi:excisionase family DNA binding protein
MIDPVLRPISIGSEVGLHRFLDVTKLLLFSKDNDMLQTTDQPHTLAPLLTTREAADLLRISQRTLWTLTNTGNIPSVRVGRSVRYDEHDLSKWIDAQKSA